MSTPQYYQALRSIAATFDERFYFIDEWQYEKTSYPRKVTRVFVPGGCFRCRKTRKGDAWSGNTHPAQPETPSPQWISSFRYLKLLSDNGDCGRRMCEGEERSSHPVNRGKPDWKIHVLPNRANPP